MRHRTLFQHLCAKEGRNLKGLFESMMIRKGGATKNLELEPMVLLSRQERCLFGHFIKNHSDSFCESHLNYHT